MAEFIHENMLAVIAAVVLFITLLAGYIVDRRNKKLMKIEDIKKDEGINPINLALTEETVENIPNEEQIEIEEPSQPEEYHEEINVIDSDPAPETEKVEYKMELPKQTYEGGEYFQTVSEKLKEEDETIEKLLKTDNIQAIKNSINYNNKKYVLNQQSTVGNIHLDRIDLPNIKFKEDIPDADVWK